MPEQVAEASEPIAHRGHDLIVAVGPATVAFDAHLSNARHGYSDED